MPFTAGLPETGCGAGSMLANTHQVRGMLPVIMRGLGVGTLLDAPCGDFNWMAHTDLSSVDYIGCDYDTEHVRSAIIRGSQPIYYQPRSKRVLTLDICLDRLPTADMMLCRDFLQHLPTETVCGVLKNFLASGITWLLATSHSNLENGEIAKAGMFRLLNLTAPPFGLPVPENFIADGDGRIIGLWNRNEITC